MHLLLDPAAWASLLTLTALEIVLGVDNIVVLSILTARLPSSEARRARSVGLALALALRLLLLTALSSIVKLTTPLFTLGELSFSWRDLILIGGGLFLIFKATEEIHGEIEGREDNSPRATKPQFRVVIAHIALMDLIFSLDSIVTAIGLAQNIEVMAAAICIAIGIMYFAANVTGEFIERHPTLKMLALAFLILIGAVLVADGFGARLPRVYIYFAMGFAGLVEALNIWAKNAASRAATGRDSDARTRQKATRASPGEAKAFSDSNSLAKKRPLQTAAQSAHRKQGRKKARRK